MFISVKNANSDPVSSTWLLNPKTVSLLWYPKVIRWLGGLLVERRTSVSQIRGSIPGQVAAV